MSQEYKIFIGGEWIATGQTQEIRNPFNNEVVGRVHQAGPPEAECAVQSAIRAFASYRKLPAYRRAEILQKITDGIRSRKEDLARMITIEAGKPITDARREADRAVMTFQTAMEESKRLAGEVLRLDLMAGSEGRFGLARRFPIGPVLGITPFNFPLNLVAHKLAPALASGNTMVLKPAPQAPITSLLLAQIVAEAGGPPGVLNVIPTTNPLSEQMVLDDRFKLLSFTGSAKVGWMLKSKAGRKRVVLELGGNAGVIIHQDADLDLAAKRCAVGGFGYAGQTCISVQRVYVQDGVMKPFLDRFIRLVRELKVGDPLEDTTAVGPLIDPGAADRTETWVNEAVAQGATLLTGGKRLGPRLFEPTVLTHTTPGMRVCKEEVFAPVVVVEPYREFEAAVAAVNQSAYGLQAGLFTNDMKRVFAAYEELEVGGLMINEVPTYRADPMPYGGVKDSGLGREGVRYAIEEMTEIKLLAVNPT
jgi:glyceraldehyde-3-phosphate dehydrogenase (NADP+)